MAKCSAGLRPRSITAQSSFGPPPCLGRSKTKHGSGSFELFLLIPIVPSCLTKTPGSLRIRAHSTRKRAARTIGVNSRAGPAIRGSTPHKGKAGRSLLTAAAPRASSPLRVHDAEVHRVRIQRMVTAAISISYPSNTYVITHTNMRLPDLVKVP